MFHIPYIPDILCILCVIQIVRGVLLTCKVCESDDKGLRVLGNAVSGRGDNQWRHLLLVTEAHIARGLHEVASVTEAPPCG